MKSIKSGQLVLVIILVMFIIGSSYFLADRLNTNTKPATGNLNNATQSNSSILNSIINIATDSHGVSTHQFKIYGFQISLPSEYAYQEYSKLNSEIITYKLSRSNQNTSEQKNRQTPTGFNTSAEDIILLSLYQNENHYNELTPISTIKYWIAQTESGERPIISLEKLAAKRPEYYAEQANGVGGAIGQYFYIITPKYIFVLRSNDVSKEELETINQSITLI